MVRLNAELFPMSETERGLLQRHGVRPVEVEAAEPEQILPHVRTAHAVCVVSAKLPAAVIDGLERCVLISRIGNGTDRIDVARATERGILVSNVPDFSTEEMADHVMAMILSLGRRIPRMARHMRAGAYRKARAESLALRRLSNLTLGLIGWGASAIAVTRRARPCGLTVIATRRDMDRPSPEAEELGVDMVDLDELLQRSDFVSLHLPLTGQTRRLLDRERLERMKPGAFLINASRGDIGRRGRPGRAAARRAARRRRPRHVRHHRDLRRDRGGPDPPAGDRRQRHRHAPRVGPVRGLDAGRGPPAASRTWPACSAATCPRPDHVVNPEVVPRVPLKPHDPALLEDE